MQRPRLRPLALAALAFGLALAAGAASARSYAITDLGDLGGGVTHPKAINDRGMITGDSTRVHHHGENDGVMFLRVKSKLMSDPSRFVGPTMGLGVNDAGVVVGYFSHGTYEEPRMWTRAGEQAFPDGIFGRAAAINDAGAVTGEITGRNGKFVAQQAFRWQDGVLQELSPPAGFDLATGRAINAAGDIAGSIWTSGHTIEHPMMVVGDTTHDLGQVGDAGAGATGINASRAVCGTAWTSAGDRLFVWQAGAVTFAPETDDLRDARGNAINDAGVVVGSAVRKKYGRHAAILEDGELQDLNDLVVEKGGWQLTDATSINNAGQIVGVGNLDGQHGHGFLLTPLD